MPDSLWITQVPWFEILGRTTGVYFVLLFGLRVVGKRHIGQMSPFDLVLLLLISNAVQNAMTGPDSSLTGGVVAAVTLLLLSVVTSWVLRHNARLSRFIEGNETLLVYQGRVIEEHLSHESLTREELMQSLREHGVASPDDVYMAVLEVDGAISVVRKSDVAQTHRSNPKRLRYLKKHQ